MDEEQLHRLANTIRPLDEDARTAARQRQARLTKPPGALGRLEDLSIWLAGVRGTASPPLREKALIVAAADHGVARLGVSAYPQQVTAQMVLNFLAGGAAVNVLARQAGVRVVVVDAGVAADLPDDRRLVRRSAGRGTADLSSGPAMTREQALYTLTSGVELAIAEARAGADVLGIGDMGIGNTTASAAITAVFGGTPAASVTGRGTGISDQRLAEKVHRVQQAIAVNRPDAADGVDVLATIGGFEIGLLAGVCIGAASAGIPLVVDGFIATAAALIAASVAPLSRLYMLAAHRSAEPGHDAALACLGLTPLLDLQMRLGEGTGATLAIMLLESASRILAEMATFDEAGVSGSDEATAGEG